MALDILANLLSSEIDNALDFHCGLIDRLIRFATMILLCLQLAPVSCLQPCVSILVFLLVLLNKAKVLSGVKSSLLTLLGSPVVKVDRLSL